MEYALIACVLILGLCAALNARGLARLRRDVLTNDQRAHYYIGVVNGLVHDAERAFESLDERLSARQDDLAKRLLGDEASADAQFRLVRDRLRNAEDSLAALHARLSLLAPPRDEFPPSLRSEPREDVVPAGDFLEGYRPGPVG